MLGDYSAINDLLYEHEGQKVCNVIKKYYIVPPQFSVQGGLYTDDIRLEINPAEGFKLAVTSDGVDPTIDDVVNDGFKLDIKEGSVIIKACSISENNDLGPIITNEYIVEYENPSFPYISPAAGSYYEETYITMYADNGSTIYYTWGDEEVSTDSTIYTDPILIPAGNNVLSVLVEDKHGLFSDVYKANYKYYPE